MKLELKNISYSARLSEETAAYAAVLYRDGKPVANISNDGHGGPDRQHPIAPNTYTDLKEIDAWLAANLPPRDLSRFKMPPSPMDLESWCSMQLDRHATKQSLKRLLTNNVIMVDGGKVYRVKLRRSNKPKDVVMIQTIAAVHTRHPTAIILNRLEFDKALDLYMNSEAI